jgi:hypothetical protein
VPGLVKNNSNCHHYSQLYSQTYADPQTVESWRHLKPIAAEVTMSLSIVKEILTVATFRALLCGVSGSSRDGAARL